MKREDPPAAYEAGPQTPIKLLNTMGAVITELKERINPTKEPERGFKRKVVARRASLWL